MRQFEIRKGDVGVVRGWNTFIGELLEGFEEFLLDEYEVRNRIVRLTAPRYLGKGYMDSSGQYVLTGIYQNEESRWMRRDEVMDMIDHRFNMRLVPQRVENNLEPVSREFFEIEQLMRQRVGVR